MGDAILVARAIDQDARAFREIVCRYSRLMRAYVARLLGSQSEADDVVQNAFVVAWRKLETLRDPSALKPWLMRVASHEATAVLRQRAPQVPIDAVAETASPGPGPDRVVLQRAQVSAVSAVLGTLPETQRQCWLLREMAGLSYEEIAAELGVPASTVRGQLARARTAITVSMEGWR
ncbi:RNA polymerase sigma factor [Leucobacter japonicus]|uniref:RNA polymerase sigma factor n=1 Tax=Leucobacter japonicus TaxID=1461259 RepID=UPI000B051117|nr:sigma-70 family RNA polymerase sigma factor [Leucobacter japonicus]